MLGGRIQPSKHSAVSSTGTICTGVLFAGGFPQLGIAETEQETRYENEKFSFGLSYPSTWKKSTKPVRTHLEEVQFKKGGGTEIGIVVDPVKIESITEFGTAKEVAKRVVGVERAKDGVTSAKLIAASQTEKSGIPYYMIEYESSSSRGDKHFISKAGTLNVLLYLTAKTSKFLEDEAALRAGAESFEVSAL
ncbi:hypothetical protein GUITHDRAFT_98988 [Guillardia theta CCMP2712]|uniref:PsbP C-terminal domain-containing protein n=1 Tax=Guillardia theta (strain CCMP2712) TaxID=905079 RepID=L1K4B8_GUITC|nr:hypothetical protein GUITHDRAFT_98988 [Guillardia theta CCMP2712]EKX55208.1 hypothetical protein GUITHDRAFT_98988 [Guillardia theta CCMP2712]|eukprot:XP_005842188.1 hypothetical protein GUITHDRAFT_98988 [Guillardia theta CCMP2712]